MSIPKPKIPKTPLKILFPEPDSVRGPFFVSAQGLALHEKKRDISDEEVDALAQLIFNAYLEWKQQ